VSFAIKPGLSVRRELTRIARKELGSASRHLLRARPTDADVFEARKSVKKVEAVTRLLDHAGSPAPSRDLRRLRMSRKGLSRLRDAHALIETLEHVQSRFARRIPKRTSAMIRAHLTRRKSEMTRRALAATGSLARAGKSLRKVRRAAKRWPTGAIGVSDLPRLLRKSFRASEKAMKRAQVRGEPADFHAWRKRVKSLSYQLRLAERLVSGLGLQSQAFKELARALGEHHNLVVLRTTLRRDRHLRKIGVDLAAMSSALESEWRRAALVLGERLHALPAKKFAKDLRRRLRPKGTARRKPSVRTRQARQALTRIS
jgi:hypothetical protein